MYFLRYVIAFVLRLFIVVPFVLLRHLFHGASEFLDSIAHGLGSAERALRQISHAPYISVLDEKIAKMSEEQKLATLKKLRDSHE